MTNTNFVRNNSKWKALMPPFAVARGARRWQPGEVWAARGPDNTNGAVFRVLRPKSDAAVGNDVYDVEVLASAGSWFHRRHRFQRFSLGSYFGQHSVLVKEVPAPKVEKDLQEFQLTVVPTKRDVAKSLALLASPTPPGRTRCCPLALAATRAVRARFRRWKGAEVVVGPTTGRVLVDGRSRFRVDLPQEFSNFIYQFDNASRAGASPPVSISLAAPATLTFKRVES